MRFRGHPILGAIAGLLLGIFVAGDLMFFKVSPLNSGIAIAPPIAGLILGLLVAWVAPFRRRRRATR